MDLTALIADDPYLAPYAPQLQARLAHLNTVLAHINTHHASLDAFSSSYSTRGFQILHDRIIYTEWAPNAARAFLIGDFNQWNRDDCEMTRDAYGVWTIHLMHQNGVCRIAHGSKVKVFIMSPRQGLEVSPRLCRKNKNTDFHFLDEFYNHIDEILISRSQ